MNETKELDLEIADLGDAKELTQGALVPNLGEEHPFLIYRAS